MSPTVFLPRPTLVLAVAALAAGCVGGLDDTVPDVPMGPWDPIVEKHDHWDPAEHAFASNVTLLDWQPLAATGESPGAHALTRHGNVLAVQLNGAGYEGFVLLDVGEPGAPRELGRFADASIRAGDRTLMFSDDGTTVFVSGERAPADAARGKRGGVVAVDVRDPANPTEVAFVEVPPYGPHTLFAYADGGEQYVYVTGVGVRIFRYDATGETFELVGQYTAATPERFLLDNPYTADPGDAGEAYSFAFRDVYGHDMFVGKDEASGKTYLYAAYAYDGFKIVDVTDPANPVEVGTWNPADEHAPWYVHTVWVDRMGDRTVAVVGTEVFESRHDEVPSPVWVLDVTDPVSPELLGTWVNPGEHGSRNLMFSAHDLRIRDGVVVLSHYHGGTWMLDLAAWASGESPREVTLGYYLPHADHGYRREGDPPRTDISLDGIPLTMDVEWSGEENVYYAADMHTGLHTLRFHPAG